MPIDQGKELSIKVMNWAFIQTFLEQLDWLDLRWFDSTFKKTPHSRSITQCDLAPNSGGSLVKIQLPWFWSQLGLVQQVQVGNSQCTLLILLMWISYNVPGHNEQRCPTGIPELRSPSPLPQSARFLVFFQSPWQRKDTFPRAPFCSWQLNLYCWDSEEQRSGEVKYFHSDAGVPAEGMEESIHQRVHSACCSEHQVCLQNLNSRLGAKAGS